MIKNQKSRVKFSVVQDENARIAELIPLAKKIDIVSAWVTKSQNFNDLVDKTKEKEDGNAFCRLVVGTSSGGTDPDVFKTFASVAPDSCRVPSQALRKSGIFHPKLYIFHEVKGEDVVLVGSMNFTRSGLHSNKELLIELKGDVEDLKKWFEDVWSDSHPISSAELKQCQLAWNNRKYRGTDPGEEPQDDGEILELRNNVFSSWKNYKRALEQRANFLTPRMTEDGDEEVVLGKDDIWTNVILDAEAVLDKGSWDQEDGRVLAGNMDPYKPFGTMGGNGDFCGVMVNSNDPRQRGAIRKILKKFQKEQASELPPEKRAEVVCSYVSKLCKEESVGLSSATRLLTIVRPDLAFSYNGSSYKKLHAMAKIKSKNRTEKKYRQLLELFYSTKWYQSPKPKRLGKELLVWRCRLALIDLLVYEHNSGANHKK